MVLNRLHICWYALVLQLINVIGDFHSLPILSQSSHSYISGFQQLAQILQRFPDICAETRFIIIPGPNDLTNHNSLPEPPV